MKHDIRWTSQKIKQRLALIEPLVYRRREELRPFRLQVLDHPKDKPPVAAEVDDNSWPVVEPHSYWIGWRTDFVLRTGFAVPEDWGDDAAVALYLPLGKANDFSHPEALAYIDGEPYAACDRHHQEIVLPEGWHDGQTRVLALHGWSGLDGWFRGELETKLFMRPCAIVQIDQPLRDFVATVRVALGVADELDEHDPAKGLLYNALNEAFALLDSREPFGNVFYGSVPAAHAALREGVAEAGPPMGVDLIGAGHAHIDVAWLWRVWQSRRKSGRTFHNVLRLMEQFPDYQFTQSQPQLYDYMREDYPQLFESIKGHVADGRWEPIGGMWVEADCNLSGAEGLARQFLLGRTFFREHFGAEAESPILWLPDVFGYAWNLPQLIKQAGLEYFFTIKISWSQYNVMPYDSFWWQGLDGTKVLTHFSTTQDEWAYRSTEVRRPTTYNAHVTPLEVLTTWRNLKQKESQQELLTAFGYGDGGGGPTREMLENIREMAEFPAVPRTRHGKAIEFFRNLEASAGESLPTWNGELYLEYHRGTYTTQAATKKGNRKSEFLLHDAEFLAAWAAVVTDYEYPQGTLTKAWQLVCLNQFHDILPGSSVGEVYEDAAVDYETVRQMGEAVREEALSKLVAVLPVETAVVVVNPTSFGGQGFGVLREPAAEIERLAGAGMQEIEGGMLIEVPEIEPYGLVALAADNGEVAKVDNPVTVVDVEGAFVLENEFLHVTLSYDGEIVRLFDKSANRSVLPEGERGNLFQAFEDRPMAWDAWDIDIFYDDKQYVAESATSAEIIEHGPLRVGVRIERPLMNSRIVQTVYLYRGRRRLDFETCVDWRERHVLLKVAFPVEVLSPTATFEVQWGNVERPTHRNTSWDWARFETCAQKWVDLSEADYGVSLLNDCKYGHDVQGNVLRLTLLRAPTYPDPEADQGEHRFTYSLYPHEGDWRNGTAREAYELNNPLIVRQVSGGQGGDDLMSLVSVDAPHVIVETVKRAEDGDGLIVRLYEHERKRGMVRLNVGVGVSAAYRCNLLEENQETLVVEDGTVVLGVRPYQIVTVRLVL